MKKFLFLLFSLCIISVLSFDVSAEQDYPEKFDLREEFHIPEAGNQNGKNICWAFSFLGSVETQLNKKYEPTDLSEWYMTHSAFTGSCKFPVVNTSNDLFLEEGSNNIAVSVTSGWRGIALENDIPFGSSADMINRYNIKKSMAHNTAPEYIVTDVLGLEPWVSDHRHYSPEYIKNLLYSGAAVSCTCSMSDIYLNKETNALFCSSDYSYKKDPYYHAVLITGWDDSFSRENFSENCRPLNDGAWIARNSYGPEWGENGYFYISYEDTSLLEAVACTGAEKNTYKNIYQHDEYGWTTSLPSDFTEKFFKEKAPEDPSTGYMANVFQASSDEYISAVSFYTIEENAKYEVTLYTELSDPSDPVSGVKSSYTTGTQTHKGYHTVTLRTPAHVAENEFFSVAVKIKNPSSCFTTPVEACIRMISKDEFVISNIQSIDKKIHKNESFISSDGITWHDLFVSKNGETPVAVYLNDSSFPCIPEDETTRQFSWGNVCVKAFSCSDIPLTFNSLTYDTNSDGSVTSADLIFMINLILSGDFTENADLNNDGIISAADIILLKSAF